MIRSFALAAALLLAAPLSAQHRPVHGPATAEAAASLQPAPTGASPAPNEELAAAMAKAGVGSGKQTVGNAALVATGLGLMYLAYSEGEEDGGGFGTFIGVLGAASFWGGIIRQFFYRAD
jgi:hypothetical protein